MKANIESLILYTSYEEKFCKLTDAQFGQLVRALIAYQKTGVIPDIGDAVVAMAFDVARYDIDGNNKKYNAKIEALSEAGKKGNQKRWKNRKCDQGDKNIANATNESQMGEKIAVNLNVNDNLLLSKKQTVIESPDDRDAVNEKFHEFWSLYPRKENEDAACRTWISMHYDMETVEQILAALRLNLAKNGSWKRAGGRYIPKAENWLLDRRWRDEVYEDKEDQKRKPNQFTSFEQREYSVTDFEELERKKLGVRK